ncbi:MAG: hypothetical protein AAGB34_03360 [Planctomycetota bacterium]
MSKYACAAVVAIAGAVASASAAPLNLVASGGVAGDGTLYTVPSNSAPLWGVFSRGDRHIRGFFEFDLSTIGGPDVASASISGGFFEANFYSGNPLGNNAASSFRPANITYFIYGTNDAGPLDAADFNNFTTEGAVSTIGTIARPDGANGWTVDLTGTDITAAVQAVVDGGFSRVGFGAQLNNVDGNMTSRIVRVADIAIDVEAVPAPGAAALLALGGLSATRRRRA